MTKPIGLRAFAQLDPTQFKPRPKPFADWDTGALKNEIMCGATQTLADWLEASLRELHRDGVNQEDVTITHRGGRTTIRVDGVDRFEFKMKYSYGRMK